MPKTCCNTVMLRERCNIQQDGSTPDNPEEDFTSNFASNIPCSVRTISGDETYRGRQIEPTISHIVELRYRRGVTSAMRVAITAGIYKDRVLNINSVRPIQVNGRPPMLELYCVERG